MEEYLRATRRLVRKLRSIIEDRKRSYESKEGLKSYESPSWAFRQAHINGAREELDFINDLFEFLGD